MRWKRILAILAGIIIILIVAVYAVLLSYDFNKMKPRIERAVLEATGRELKLGGDIELDIGFAPTLVVSNVSFQNAPWGSRPEALKVQRLEVQVALLPLIRGKIAVKRLILIKPEILIETNMAGVSNLEFKPQEKTMPVAPEKEGPAKAKVGPPAFSVGKIRVVDGRLTYKDGRSGKNYTLKLTRMTAVTAGMNDSIRIALRGAYNGGEFDISGRLGPLDALTDSDTEWPLHLTAKAAGVTLAIDGSIKDAFSRRGIKLKFKANAGDLNGLEETAGITLPIKGPIGLSGRLTDPASNVYRVAGLKLKLGKSDIAGNIDVTIAGPRPLLKARLFSDKLDLRQAFKQGDSTETKRSGSIKPAKDKKIFSRAPLPFSLLKTADADIKIKARQLITAQLALHDAAIGVSLKKGRLNVKPLKALVGGGAMDGSMEISPRGKTANLEARLKINKADLGRMLKDMDVTHAVEGKVDVDIQVRARGGSVKALMAGLNGRTSVVMEKGSIDNKFLRLLGGDLTSNVFRLINPYAAKEEATVINCMVSGFNIKDGLARSSALVLDTSYMSVIGDGRINLKTEGLNVSLKPVTKKGIGKSGLGKLSLSLGALAKPFKLGGTLGNPKLAIDPTQAALSIGKTIGGTALFGPVGIASALININKGDENPCLAAIETSRKGAGPKNAKKRGVANKAAGRITEGVEGVGKGLRKLFGK